MNRKLIIIAVVIGLVAVGLVFGVQYFTNGSKSSDYKSACGYDDCDWTGTVTIKIGGPFPPKCPKCGRQSALNISMCKQCGNKQIPNELLRQHIPGKEKLPSQTACGECGGPIRRGD